MRHLDETPIDPEIAACLDAIDATLAGEPVDPRHAELAELALLLADDRPRPRPGLCLQPRRPGGAAVRRSAVPRRGVRAGRGRPFALAGLAGAASDRRGAGRGVRAALVVVVLGNLHDELELELLQQLGSVDVDAGCGVRPASSSAGAKLVRVLGGSSAASGSAKHVRLQRAPSASIGLRRRPARGLTAVGRSVRPSPSRPTAARSSSPPSLT